MLSKCLLSSSDASLRPAPPEHHEDTGGQVITDLDANLGTNVLTCEIITTLCSGPGLKLPNGLAPALITEVDNRSNSRTPCQCYQDAYLNALSLPLRIPDILIYIHDDVEIFDPLWMSKVLALFFSHPACVVAGLGGATSLGREGLYKRPYRISDMARGGYASNQRDWAVHGGHLGDGGSVRVAVIDAFFMAVRTSFLRGLGDRTAHGTGSGVGGWPVGSLSHHGLDLWICCEAARAGKEIWATGVDCMHYGGGTSTNALYREAKWLKGGSLVSDHEEPHKWLHREFKDVLPISVKGELC